MTLKVVLRLFRNNHNIVSKYNIIYVYLTYNVLKMPEWAKTQIYQKQNIKREAHLVLRLNCVH